MKKIVLVLLLVLVLAVTLVGCDEGDSSTTTPGSENDAATQTPGDNDGPSETVTYNVTWMNERGEQITKTTVEEGKTPSYTYSVADTAEWDYTFVGWSASSDGEVLSSLPTATEDATYYAIVIKVKRKYTVTFHSNGGSAVQSQEVEYGSKATRPENPTYSAHKFVEWASAASGGVAIDFDAPITENLDCYAVWNQVVDAKALLSALLSGYRMNPMADIPQAMLPGYSANLVNANNLVDGYSSFVNVGSISYGFGEQWHMIVDNLQQSEVFFNVLTVVDTLSSTSITAFNNYFDKNPANTARHEFESGIYSITIVLDEQYIWYVVEYAVELPVLGEQTVQIALKMDIETGEKVARIQLGDANALTYRVTENSYEFAIKYLGTRRAMFSVERGKDGSVSGKIYEYLTVGSAEHASCAEFYITEDYVTAVGNKASGMMLFDKYIAELYDAKTGRLIGYEVEETLSKILFNTLWFNLKDVSGITSIKYVPAAGEEEAKIYVNGKSTVWTAPTAGGISLKYFPRRFDIEFRTQYVYSYDAENGTYVEHKIEVPMLFVQEENFDTLIADMEKANDITVSVGVSNKNLQKLLADYDALISVFKQDKDQITPDAILAYIGQKIVF